MTTVVVLADPPAVGEPVPELQERLTLDERQSLYRAMLADVCRVVQHGEAELVVNYPPADQTAGDVDTEQAIREVVSSAVPTPGDVRYERQVGETKAARIGNAITHLLESEGLPTAGFVEPTAPFLRREHIGNAAMSLRSSDVVLGPSTEGRLYFGAFREPIDFEDCFDSPAVETLTARAREAGHDVDFLPVLARLETEQDLQTVSPLLRSRVQAERIAPVRTAEWFADQQS